MERHKVCSKVEDDAKSVLDWEVATLVGNKGGCQINGELVDGFKERDKTTYLDVKTKRNLEIGPTSPYPIPVRFSCEGTELVPMPIGPLTHAPKPDDVPSIVIDTITAEFGEEPHR